MQTTVHESNKQHNNEPKANAWALLPVLVFIIAYIGLNISISFFPNLRDYIGEVSLVPAFVIALIVALLQNHKRPFTDRLKTAGKGVGNHSIIMMILIFILAGAFAGAVGRSSASSVAYFLLSIFPSNFSVLVIFVVSCLVSLAMGTSVGSITLIVPIALSVAAASGQDPAMCVACTICGSMFGDNLSMISDTAIAACSGLGCKPKEKFIENLKICIPAAIITFFIFLIASFQKGNGSTITEAYSLIEFVPYVIVLILSIAGVNVLLVLGVGIISGTVIMLIQGNLSIVDYLNDVVCGVQGMYEIIFITILVAAMASLINKNGGFNCVLSLINKLCKTKKSAQIGCGILVSLMDLITANNTVAIVVSSPIAKEVCNIYHIRRRRVASVIDTFSCIVQGILPYGAQVMIAVSLCQNSGLALNAFQLVPLCLYQYILLVFVLFFILTGIADKTPS